MVDRLLGLDIRYDPGTTPAHPLVGGWALDLPLLTDHGPTRLATLLRPARPVLVDLSPDRWLQAAASGWPTGSRLPWLATTSRWRDAGAPGRVRGLGRGRRRPGSVRSDTATLLVVMRPVVAGLLQRLQTLTDPRAKRGIRHRFASLLAMVACGVLSGARSFVAIGEFAAELPQATLARLGAGRHPTTGRYVAPSEATCAAPSSALIPTSSTRSSAPGSPSKPHRARPRRRGIDEEVHVRLTTCS